MRKRLSPLKDFLHRESSGGILLLTASAVGLIVANSPFGDEYFSVLAREFEIGDGLFHIKLTTLKFVNYILMTFFFFVVGLEIKRELTTGHLATFRNAIMPFLGALGGMVFPAAIYLLVARGSDARGWGVPVATDIALAVGLLAIVGKTAPSSLRTFLLGLAVIDDIGAILIIAFIYSSGVGLAWVLAATSAIILIVASRMLGIRGLSIYLLLGALLWYFLYRSGIHATLSGVILGLLTPNVPKSQESSEIADDHPVTVIEWLEEKLHPWTSFVIVPIFAFANTGVVITVNSIQDAVTSPIAWGIFLGLVAGKPLGIVISIFLAKKMNIGDYPEGASTNQLIATGSAAGIGFTVAIFIADLAFKSQSSQDLAVFAVISASIVSGIISWVLFAALRGKRQPK